MDVTTTTNDYAALLRRLSVAESDYNACLADWKQMIADGCSRVEIFNAHHSDRLQDLNWVKMDASAAIRKFDRVRKTCG